MRILHYFSNGTDFLIGVLNKQGLGYVVGRYCLTMDIGTDYRVVINARSIWWHRISLFIVTRGPFYYERGRRPSEFIIN